MIKTIKSTSGYYLYIDEEKYQSQREKKKIKGLKNIERVLSLENVPDNFLGECGISYNREDNANAGISIANFKMTGSGPISITTSNFETVIFAAASNLLTIKIEHFTDRSRNYLWPNTNHPEFNSWANDCIIYCLFHKKNYSGSYKNDNINMINEWFWMSSNQILNIDIVNTIPMIDIYNALISVKKERFLFNLIQNKINKNLISDNAIRVFEMACNITENSFLYRNSERDSLMLDTWDAGWYQIRNMLSDDIKNQIADFYVLYDKFADELKHGVYKFGFLK